MEFIMLRLIQLSKRELCVLDELFFILKHENNGWLTGSEESPDKERLLINELIQIERDKREEYAALVLEMDCPACTREEKQILQQLAENVLKYKNQLLEKLNDELLSVIKKISIENTRFQLMLEEQFNSDVETIDFDQVLPYLPSINSANSLHFETLSPVHQIHSN